MRLSFVGAQGRPADPQRMAARAGLIRHDEPGHLDLSSPDQLQVARGRGGATMGSTEKQPCPPGEHAHVVLPSHPGERAFDHLLASIDTTAAYRLELRPGALQPQVVTRLENFPPEMRLGADQPLRRPGNR